MKPPAVFVTGAAAVSALGVEWRGLADALERRSMRPAPSAQLAQSHPGTLVSEVLTIPSAFDADARVRKLMSRGARLGAIAVKKALEDASWNEGHEEVGFFCGVGASGGSMDELTEMLRASIDEGQFSLAQFGSAGLAACNPLFAFQLMNNFTLCHGAILNGVAGPNAAFYSRGTGTVAALAEAVQALTDGDCRRCLAGGADSALHPVTWSELVREGFAAQGLVPAEGAGLLALEVEAQRPLAVLEHCRFRGPEVSASEFLGDVLPLLEEPVDRVVIAPWGESSRADLRWAADSFLPRIPILDVSEMFGGALAAAPALAWATALDLLVSQKARGTLILNRGTDGGTGAVCLRRPT